MTRKEANVRIVEILTNAIEMYPDQRFGQIMRNLDVIEEINESVWKDEFYLESEELLERVMDRLSEMP